MGSSSFPTLVEIKQRLPAKFFRPSLSLSLYYVARSLVLAALLAFGYNAAAAYVSKLILLPLYWLAQGTVFWGFFTLGHDCGHGSFSKFPTVNWWVGVVLHSIILTPYEPWRLSHRSHHKNTGNMDKDEIFYVDSPQSHWVSLLLGWVGGAWFLYLLVSNVPGRRGYDAYFSKEFRPVRWQLIGSFAALAGVIKLIVLAIQTYGLRWVVELYLGPVFVFSVWLVVVTFLHHHDEAVPWYDDEHWDIVKGSLSSIDRDYGYVVNNVIHDIGTHQIHHLFPKIPHYHLVEATAAFHEAYPELKKSNEGSNIVAFFKGVYQWIARAGYYDKEKGTFQYGKQKSQ